MVLSEAQASAINQSGVETLLDFQLKPGIALTLAGSGRTGGVRQTSLSACLNHLLNRQEDVAGSSQSNPSIAHQYTSRLAIPNDANEVQGFGLLAVGPLNMDENVLRQRRTENVTAAEELIRQCSQLLSRDCVSRPFLAVN
ncbi:unnamed protein product [Leuciscus chuanchicus]